MFTRYAPRLVAVAAGLFLFAGSCLLSCKGPGDEPEGSRCVMVALPQWFYPSEERPWLVPAWDTARREASGFELVPELVPGKTEHILQRLLVTRASGQGPDVACLRLNWMPELLGRGMLEPLDGWVAEEVWAGILPALGPAVTEAGRHYLLPYEVGVRVILYRADLVQEAGLTPPPEGWTLEDLANYAKRLTRDLDGDGDIDQWGLGVPGARNEKSVYQWLPWFWILGGETFSAGGRIVLANPAAMRAMQWYRDLAERYRVTPPTFYSMDQEAIFQGLANGMFAMTVGGSWELAMLKKLSAHGDAIRMALLPGPLAGKPSTTLVDGWGFGLLRKDAGKREAVSRLLASLSSPEHQLEKLRASGSLPPFESAYGSRVLQEEASGRVLSMAVRTARHPDAATLAPAVLEALG
ncbi:MAG: extracellular solute-binding protein, partial [bacterium]